MFYDCTFRLQMITVLERHKDNSMIYINSCIVLHGLSQSHPDLISAAKRLINNKACEYIVDGVRRHCKVTDGRKWAHSNYPYICRICMETCAVAYHFINGRGTYNSAAKVNLRNAGIRGMFMKPPLVSSETKNDAELDLDYRDDAFSYVVSTYQKAIVEYNNDSIGRSQIINSSHVSKVITVNREGESKEHNDTRELEQHHQRKRFMRSVEYTKNLSRQEMDKITHVLFTNYHIEDNY